MNAIYARQSVDKKDSLSIEGQIDLCRRFAGDEALIFQDKGFSGKNIKRPAFTQLIQAIEEGKIQKIFVYRLDRFSRSIADFSRLWELLEEHGVEFTSVTEHFDTSSPIGRAMLNIVLVFAQLERETTAERVKDNYIHRFSLGAWPGGPAPYGFDLTKLQEDNRSVSSLAANEQASIVKEVFEEYSKPGSSLRSIARALTQRGIHGPKRENWDSVTLSRILHSPLYVQADESIYCHYAALGLQIQQDITAFDGVHACNVIGRRDRSRNKYNTLAGQRLTVANHKGFINSTLWLKVQDKLAKNPQISRANAGKHSWLTGLMKCAKCNYAVKVNYAKLEDKYYLLCSGRSNLSNCDVSIHVNLRELEDYVAQQLESMLADAPPEDIPSSSSQEAAAILEIEQKIERLVMALAESSEVSAPYISKQIERLHKERENLLNQSIQPSPAAQHLKFSQMTFEEKKLVASEFIDRILLDGEQVNICWKI